MLLRVTGVELLLRVAGVELLLRVAGVELESFGEVKCCV